MKRGPKRAIVQVRQGEQDHEQAALLACGHEVVFNTGGMAYPNSGVKPPKKGEQLGCRECGRKGK